MKEILFEGAEAIGTVINEVVVFAVTVALATLKRKWDLRKMKRKGIIRDEVKDYSKLN